MRAFGISAIRRWKRALGRGEEGKMRKKEHRKKRERRRVFIGDGKYIGKKKGILVKHVSSKSIFTE